MVVSVLQLAPSVDLHATTTVLRLIASLRASMNIESNAFASLELRLLAIRPRNDGTATASRMLATAIATSNSISVNPRPLLMCVAYDGTGR